MRNYFDALVRASGRGVGIDPSAAADHGIAEIQVQHDAPPAATSPVMAGPRMDTQRSEIITPPPVVTPTLQGPAIREYSAPPSTSYTEVASDRSLPTSPSGSAPVSSPRPQAAAPDPGQAMVHAALRWVTADVGSPGALTEIALTPEPTPPIPAQELTTHKITPATMPSVSAPEAQPVAGATALLPEALTRLRVAPIRHLEPIDQPSPWAIGTRRPASHDETVEITIGAIHLRVDAPPPQTVVQAPVPTSRPPADRPPRSALTRRALRRI